jgi:predicted dehydrogenase
MGGDRPVAISSYLRFDGSAAVDHFADIRIEFPGARMANVLLTWTAAVRRTTAVIAGTAGLLEIEGNRILLTESSGRSVDYSVTDDPDDSYHRAWFMAAAADYEDALKHGPCSEFALTNLDEAATALALTKAAQRSAARRGRAVALDAGGT